MTTIQIANIQVPYLIGSETKNFTISGKMWKYFEALTRHLTPKKSRGYFFKTMTMYPLFKSKEITDKKEVADYFRRCQFLAILQIIAFAGNSLPQFSNTTGIIKVGPSKAGKKNSCLIDDSTVLDKETNEIRDSNGSPEEPHRGHKMFNKLTQHQKEDVISVFDYMIHHLSNILDNIKTGDYPQFNPILVLQKIVKHCKENNQNNFISYLAWEIHDEPHLLTMDEQIELFSDYDKLYELWNSDFITDNHGKFRIYILCMYYNEMASCGHIVGK